MRDLTILIDGIRAVRDARRQFLRRWRLERLPGYLASAPSALDRLTADIARAGNTFEEAAGQARTSTKTRKSLKTRTTWLYPHGRMADEGE